MTMLLGLWLMMALVVIFVRQQVACGCVANVVIGLLLMGLGLLLLSVAGVIPPNLICEKGPYVSLCLN